MSFLLSDTNTDVTDHIFFIFFFTPLHWLLGSSKSNLELNLSNYLALIGLILSMTLTLYFYVPVS